LSIPIDEEMSEYDPGKLAAVAAAEIESIASSAVSMALEEARAEVNKLMSGRWRRRWPRRWMVTETWSRPAARWILVKPCGAS
jgi:hypothetical protein